MPARTGKLTPRIHCTIVAATLVATVAATVKTRHEIKVLLLKRLVK